MLSSAASLVIGVDVGGTKIAAGIVDPQGQLSGRVKLPTDTSRPEKTLQSIANAITSTIEAAQVSTASIKGIGLGIPGTVDPERGIGVQAVNLGWHNVPVSAWLEERFGLPCAIENDVGAAALGEFCYGIGQAFGPRANIAYLSLGTGIASRMIINGQLYRGRHGLAGEIGHQIFVTNGPLCQCGAYGCLEAVAAGPALAKRAQQALQAGQPSILRDLLASSSSSSNLPDTQKLTSELVFAAAQQGDKLALDILTEAGQHIALAICQLAMTFDPDVVVLGGGLSQQDGPLMESIRASILHLRKQTPIFHAILTIEDVQRSGLGANTGILGAAALITTKGVFTA